MHVCVHACACIVHMCAHACVSFVGCECQSLQGEVSDLLTGRLYLGPVASCMWNFWNTENIGTLLEGCPFLLEGLVKGAGAGVLRARRWMSSLPRSMR